MATLFPKIYDIIQANPNRDAVLQLRSSEKTLRREQDTETWDIFYQKPLQPPGSLSHFLFQTDPMYEAGSISLRKQIQKEKLLEIEDRVDKELIGRRWPRKKIHDTLAEQIQSDNPPYSELTENVLCDLYKFQKIILHRKTKSISFSPPDLRTWSTQPVYVTDDEGCWSYEASKEVQLIQWLTQKEDEHWKIQWPTADGKLEEIRSEVLKRNLIAHILPGSDAKKVKKEDWARTLGRSQAIETLLRLELTMQ